MTSVEFKSSSGKLVSFIISGHALDLSKRELEGNVYDLVCCAISTISQTTLIGIIEVLKIDVNYSIKDGFLSINLENQSKNDIEACQVLLETMLLGMKSVEISYSDYIKVEVEEV